MSLFQTGFAVDSHAPIAESSTASSIAAARKRKRPSTLGPATEGETSSGGAANGEQNYVNLEKLMKKLQDGGNGSSKSSKGKGRAKPNQNAKKHDEKAESVTAIQEPQESSKENEDTTTSVKTVAQKQPKQPKNKKQKLAKPEKEPYIPDAVALAKREERQRKKAAQQSTNGARGAPAVSADGPVKQTSEQAIKTTDTATSKKIESNPQSSGLTNLQKGLQKKLGGARFRWINEQLYTTSGEKAHELIKEDPSMFEEYHSGFRSQAASWPSQPIQLFINAFLSSPSRPIIADLGCGDAQLAKTLSAQGFTVLSFDLIAANPWIVEAQCTKHVPLPGSDTSTGNESEGAVVDVVVCCLSLMGHDWINMIKESRRILKAGGKLRIAEVSSRFSDIPGFIDLIQQVGFKLQSKDDSNTHFIIFEFAKVAKKGSASNAETDGEAVMERSAKLLKPCLYKKR